MTRPHVRKGGVLMALLSLAGCHSFTPVDRSAIEPGQSLRVTLTREEALRQVEALGDLREQIQGTVREAGGPSLGLTMASPPAYAVGDPRAAGLRSYLELPWSGVERVELKRFDWVRTGLFAAAAAVVTVAILEVTDDSGGGNGEGGGVDQQRVRIPLLTFRR
ncbi:MAG: hypothetical protein RQ751_00815 [Longimicrobiales bacterium]|nr:hypothetical protein [Longimicrobiales bacterium]